MANVGRIAAQASAGEPVAAMASRTSATNPRTTGVSSTYSSAAIGRVCREPGGASRPGTVGGMDADGLLLVTGEAGVGKSRLLAEVRSYAAEAGAAVLPGRAVAGSAPLRPLSEALLAGYRGRPVPEAGEETAALVRRAAATLRLAPLLRALAALRTPVDAFFDKVLVNSSEAAERANRLRLLGQVRDAMGRVADFSQVTG